MKPDPITIEVIRNRLIAASRDIRRTVERAAYSPVLYEVVDFSCGILDSEANLLAETPGLPIFLANLNYSVVSTYQTIGRENLRPGDVILCNDPYCGFQAAAAPRCGHERAPRTDSPAMPQLPFRRARAFGRARLPAAAVA